MTKADWKWYRKDGRWKYQITGVTTSAGPVLYFGASVMKVGTMYDPFFKNAKGPRSEDLNKAKAWAVEKQEKFLEEDAKSKKEVAEEQKERAAKKVEEPAEVVGTMLVRESKTGHASKKIDVELFLDQNICSPSVQEWCKNRLREAFANGEMIETKAARYRAAREDDDLSSLRTLEANQDRETGTGIVEKPAPAEKSSAPTEEGGRRPRRTRRKREPKRLTTEGTGGGIFKAGTAKADLFDILSDGKKHKVSALKAHLERIGRSAGLIRHVVKGIEAAGGTVTGDIKTSLQVTLPKRGTK